MSTYLNEAHARHVAWAERDLDRAFAALADSELKRRDEAAARVATAARRLELWLALSPALRALIDPPES